MSFSKRDTVTYRRDEKFGHKLLTPEERIKLLKPYLPPPPTRTPARTNDGKTSSPPSAEPTSSSSSSSSPGLGLGVRQFLKTQLHLLVFAIIHAIFSLHIRLRQTCHAVVDRVYAVLYYHHRTPELIERDVRGLRRLPQHLSIILTLEEHTKGGAELEKLVDEAADVAAWCASAGIYQLTIYERTGILKAYLPETHRAISQKLAAYFGPKYPSLTVAAPHVPPVDSPVSPRARRRSQAGAADANAAPPKHLSILLISADDGRDSVVDLTKTLAEMAQRQKISTADISIELVDAELTESVMGEPDLLILFGPYVELAGYPPWQVRLTEIFHVQDNQGVGYQVFYRGLCSFARAQMRFGR